MHSQNKEQNHGEYLGGESRLQFVAPEAEKQAHNCQRQKAKDHYNLWPHGPMDHIYSQAVSGHGSLPTSSRNPEWLRSASQQGHNPRTTPLGKHTTHLRLWQPPQDPAGSPVGLALPRVQQTRTNSPGKCTITSGCSDTPVWPNHTEHSPHILAALAVPFPLHSTTELLLLSHFVSDLCDPIDSSPPGSPVPGILQARTLE